ncbi:MAG: hypothetical protein QG626_655 [Patescibacteria group bacterium]|jgi:hypothetical protein|nr:hypothetical protein [Patescibacteria group bacterium]
MFKYYVEFAGYSLCFSFTALLCTGFIRYFATNLSFLADLGLWITVGLFLMAMGSIPFAFMGWVTESKQRNVQVRRIRVVQRSTSTDGRVVEVLEPEDD